MASSNDSSRTFRSVVWPLIVALLMLSGCNQLASSTANVEGVRAYQTGNYEAAREQFSTALAAPRSTGRAARGTSPAVKAAQHNSR